MTNEELLSQLRDEIPKITEFIIWLKHHPWKSPIKGKIISDWINVRRILSDL